MPRSLTPRKKGYIFASILVVLAILVAYLAFSNNALAVDMSFELAGAVLIAIGGWLVGLPNVAHGYLSELVSSHIGFVSKLREEKDSDERDHWKAVDIIQQQIDQVNKIKKKHRMLGDENISDYEDVLRNLHDRIDSMDLDFEGQDLRKIRNEIDKMNKAIVEAIATHLGVDRLLVSAPTLAMFDQTEAPPIRRLY